MRKQTAKDVFAAELEAMLDEMPLSKVRVAELCRRVDAAVPTFYYHFRDKYELVAWIYLRDFGAVVAARESGYGSDVLDAVMARMEGRRGFYAAAWTDKSQNSIADYFQQVNEELSDDAVRRLTGEGLTRAQRLELVYHSFGITHLFMGWILGEVDATRSELAELMVAKTPAFLVEAFAAYPYSAKELLAKAQRRKA